MSTVRQVNKRSGQFFNLRYQLEMDALKRIFGPAALEGLPEDIEAVLDALGEPMDIPCRPASTSNVVQFPVAPRGD